MKAPPPPSAAPSPAAPAGACNADAAKYAIGRALDDALTAEVRTRAGAQRVRVVRPGQMVTMEFDEQRLTIEVDAAGKVVAARCG